MNDQHKLQEKLDNAKKYVSDKTFKVGNRSFRLLSVLIYACCLLVSFFIWLDLSENNVEVITREFSGVTLGIDGEAELQRKGLAVFGEYTDQITVSVKGPKNRINRLDDDELTAYVDVSEVTASGKVKLDINVRGADRYEYTVSPSTIRVFVDENDEIDIPVEVDETYDIIPDSYSYEIVTDTEFVTVKGAKSVLSKIKSAKVYVELGTITTGFSRRDRITFVGEDGRAVDGEYFSSDITSVGVDVKVYTEKTVPLVSNFKYGWIKSANVKIATTPAMITLRGDPRRLQDINEVRLPEIDETTLDTLSTGMVNPILEDGVVAVNLTEKIQRKVELVRTEKITVTLNTADIDVRVPSDCTYSFSDKTFEVTCIVASGNSKRVTADMFRLSLDATTLTPGTATSATVRVSLASETNFTLFPVGLNTAQILVSTVE